MGALVGLRVVADNVTAVVDPQGLGAGSAGVIERGEGTAVSKNSRRSAQREAEREQVISQSSLHFLSPFSDQAAGPNPPHEWCSLRSSFRLDRICSGANNR